MLILNRSTFNYAGVVLLFVLFSATAFAQDTYSIIRVQGSIYNLTQKKTLAQGDKLTPNDKIEFKSPDSKALAISSKNGRFVISKSPGTATQGSELVSFVKNVVLPMKSNGQLSTRSGEAIAANNIKDHFGTASYAIIGDVYPLKVSTGSFPMNDNQYFVYRYMYNGTAVVKQIYSSNDTLFIDKSLLYQLEDQPIPVEQTSRVDIYYVSDAESEASQKVVNFKPVFVPEEELKSECRVLAATLKAQKMLPQDIQRQLIEYITDAYGRTDETRLKNWLNLHLKM